MAAQGCSVKCGLKKLTLPVTVFANVLSHNIVENVKHEKRILCEDNSSLQQNNKQNEVTNKLHDARVAAEVLVRRR